MEFDHLSLLPYLLSPFQSLSTLSRRSTLLSFIMSAVVSKKLKFKGGERKADRAASPEASTDKLRSSFYQRNPRRRRDLIRRWMRAGLRSLLEIPTVGFFPRSLVFKLDRSSIEADKTGTVGWIFPTDAMEITGPSYILLPSNPPTCLAVSVPHSAKMIESPY